MPCPICQGGYGGRHEPWCPRGTWRGWWQWHIWRRLDEWLASDLLWTVLVVSAMGFAVVYVILHAQ